MKKIVISLLLTSQLAFSQTSFEELIKLSPLIELPIENILYHPTLGVLNDDFMNEFLFKKDKQQNKIYPKNYNEKGELIEVSHYRFFNGVNKVVGRINISDDFHVLVFKKPSEMWDEYVLYTFNKSGEMLSFIELFNGEKTFKCKGFKPSDYMRVKQEDCYYFSTEGVRSNISKEGILNTHFENRGYNRYNTWEFTKEGYLKLINRRQEGEFDY